MAITDYASLRQSVIDWPSLSGEQDLEQYVDTVISLGEAQINQELRLQRHLQFLSVPPDVAGTMYEAYPLPDDYLELNDVIGPSGESLVYVNPDMIYTWGGEPCEPGVYSISGGQIIFSPKIASFNIQYFAQLSALSISGNNWLLKQAPDLYLYASLMHTAVFSKESEQEMARYAAMYAATVARLQAHDWHSTLPRAQAIVSRPGRTGFKSRS